MYLGGWLVAFFHICKVCSLALNPLPNTLLPLITNLSDSSSNISPLQISTLPAAASPFSVGGPLSSAAFNETESSNAAFTCGEDAYGVPSLQSCVTAWNGIPDTTFVISFGEGDAEGNWDVIVPFRFISSEWYSNLSYHITVSKSLMRR